jgi:hypothetical protein
MSINLDFTFIFGRSRIADDSQSNFCDHNNSR